ncbi:MAG: NOL1/NOP2/sun family putative RNA methylase [Candidatus Hermodarchaeia archaeon]
MVGVLNPEAKGLAKKYGYKAFMVDRYLSLFGDETEEFLRGNDRSIPKTIRVNTLATSVQEESSRLQAKGFELKPVPDLDYAFQVLNAPFAIGATTEYLLGHYMLQSAASMWAVESLKPNAEQIIVDMCAAPGGKTTLIAQLMRNQGAVVATDISRNRIRSLRSNLSRMRVENSFVMRIDAARLPEFGIQADAVLLDAPCTGEGLIPLDSSRKQSRTLEDIVTMTQVQRKLVLAGSQLLREGGILVYATCSFAPEENEEIIDYALQECPLQVIETELPLGDPGLTSFFGREVDESLQKARRFYPYKHEMEGFFICRMKKQAA